jgi:hypothetical protein
VDLFDNPDVGAAGKSLRKGNLGYAIKIANTLASANISVNEEIVIPWNELVTETLKEINDVESKQIGG